jgi:hypothetical protein
MSRKAVKNGKKLPESPQIFRYWVEVREQANGSARQLPLNGVTKIHLPRTKREAPRPNEEILQDGAATLEATSIQDLAAQLRVRYPDDTYERTLHWERDREAEVRRAEAISKLSEIFLPRAYLEALYVIQAELERVEPDSKLSDAELERAAATRAIALIDSGEWKQRDTWVHFPSSWIREILERFASGETSLLEGSVGVRGEAAPQEKSDIKIGERKCVVNRWLPGRPGRT